MGERTMPLPQPADMSGSSHQPVRVRLTGEQLAALRRMPETVVAGLRSLRDGPAPSVADPATWERVVLDAITLAADGWAEQALALCWSVHDLWGISADREGLAVWLDGRRLILLDDRTAVADAGDGGRGQFTRCRHDMLGARLLWELA